jgi:hypothetical protein
VDDTHLTVDLTVGKNAAPGPATITVKTGSETASGVFTVGKAPPVITEVAPASGTPPDVTLKITGEETHFKRGSSIVEFGNLGVKVVAEPEVKADGLSLLVKVEIDPAALPFRSDVTVITGSEIAIGTTIFQASDKAPSITKLSFVTIGMLLS